jgi:ABC-2 type transport system ATP-binding protein
VTNAALSDVQRGPAGAIELVDVHKNFRLYGPRSVKETLVHLARGEPLTNRRAVLNGVSLSIAPCERVAIVGRNGAGKSTLFRILSGILAPDRGSVRVYGRVAPLIEITAGFVPDMTGMENLLLNAAILGLTRDEIEARKAAIVAFAGLEEFMDTPVRYFSSGMQTRLGFSVVAHVDADILLIDEALSVGDAEFQAKCIKRMRELADAGATVVFVSHDFDAVRSFCTRAIWLDGGGVRIDGPAGDVVDALLLAAGT